jgi:serine/threonine protein kinase
MTPTESIHFLESTIQMPFRFNAMLPFNDDDKREMPWLTEETRYYGIEEELRRGGRAVALRGFVSEKDGSRSNRYSQRIVIKIPNIDISLYDSSQIKEYLSRQTEESGKEWELTRRRLHKCEYANPLFDFTVYQIAYLGEIMQLPVTAQLFLQEAISLDDYLLKIRQRMTPYKGQKGISDNNWNGMNDPSIWIELAQCIATGLADIHRRRVVHGDIWPPNVFIREDSTGRPAPIFIDFGESFPLEPKGVPRQQRDHVYRAPERKDAQSIVTQQADVYSFGKLLLHLAVGEERILKESGHKRREIVREMFSRRNFGIARDNPFIIDIICKCVSLDPVDRPSMGDVLRALNSYVDPKGHPRRISKVSDRLASLTNTWDRITGEMSARGESVGPFLEELVEQRMDEVEEMIKGLSGNVLILNDTRERLILGLIGLFRRLEKGDRFLSITNPLIWRSSALGLDGRYFTATQLAAVRGASIQRAFVFSIQEVGDAWATRLSELLEKLNKHDQFPGAGKLAKSLRLGINQYRGIRQMGKARDLPEELRVDARERLTLVIKSYLNASQGICNNAFDPSVDFQSSGNCKGIYVGLIPVATLSEMRTLKSAHPLSVFFYSAAAGRDQYLLMMTDCLGRNSYGSSDENIFDSDTVYQVSKPELRGITVFKSVLGVPEDRIKKLEQVFRQSIGVAGWIDSLYKALDQTLGGAHGPRVRHTRRAF